LAETEAAGAAFHLAGKFGKAARDARAMLIEASVFRPTARLTGGPRRTRISHLASLPYPSQQPSPSAPLRFEFELQLVRLRFFWLWLWLWISKSSSPGLETWKVAQGMGGVRGLTAQVSVHRVHRFVARIFPYLHPKFHIHIMLGSKVTHCCSIKKIFGLLKYLNIYISWRRFSRFRNVFFTILGIAKSSNYSLWNTNIYLFDGSNRHH